MSKQGISKSTIRSYKNALQKYSDFTNKTLNDLIEEAEREEENPEIKFRSRKIKSYLDELDLSQSSKNHMIMLVRSFWG
ncbi:MAG: hypothetical protein ACXVHM_07220 [Methanobacterium sp.]